MNAFLTLASMTAIGAAHGAAGNWLAIKMLFRPLRPLYIGKWQVPFTPGMVPKRQKEMAETLGKIVVEHLLTAEGIKKKLESEAFKTHLEAWTRKAVSSALQNESSLGDWLKENAKIDAEALVRSLFGKAKGKTVKEIVPEAILKEAEKLIPQASNLILSAAAEYFASPQGRQSLSGMLEGFLEGQGFFANLFAGIAGQESLVQKGQAEIVKMLQKPSLYLYLCDKMKEEFDKLKDKELSGAIASEEAIVAHIKTSALDKPISLLTASWSEQIENLAVRAAEALRAMLAGNIEKIMEKAGLERVVKEQVEGFSVERLEELFMAITAKEMNAIVYFGTLLGAWIGLMQGLLVFALK